MFNYSSENAIWKLINIRENGKCFKFKEQFQTQIMMKIRISTLNKKY